MAEEDRSRGNEWPHQPGEGASPKKGRTLTQPAATDKRKKTRMIEHDINGPFVRAARGASATPQTEVVHAYRVEYSNGEVSYWNTQPEPFSDERVAEMNAAIRGWANGGRPIRSAEPVRRPVTISASDWTPSPASTP